MLTLEGLAAQEWPEKTVRQAVYIWFGPQWILICFTLHSWTHGHCIFISTRGLAGCPVNRNLTNHDLTKSGPVPCRTDDLGAVWCHGWVNMWNAPRAVGQACAHTHTLNSNKTSEYIRIIQNISQYIDNIGTIKHPRLTFMIIHGTMSVSAFRGGEAFQRRHNTPCSAWHLPLHYATVCHANISTPLKDWWHQHEQTIANRSLPQQIS